MKTKVTYCDWNGWWDGWKHGCAVEQEKASLPEAFYRWTRSLLNTFICALRGHKWTRDNESFLVECERCGEWWEDNMWA